MWAILYFGCCFNKGFAQVKKKKEHSWFMPRGQNFNISQGLEEVGSDLHGWFWGVQGFSGGRTADVVEIARELELEMELENVTELLQSCDKTFNRLRGLLLMDEQRN